MNKIFVSICLCGLITQISGVFWDDLRMRFGLTPDDTHYVKLPRLTRETDELGWTKVANSTCENDGKFSGFRYKLDSDLIYLLFDKNGIVAGLQTLYPHDEIISPESSYRYDKVPLFQNETVDGKLHSVLTAYFVPPASICTTGRTESDLLSQGTGSGVWFQTGPAPEFLLTVPKIRSEAAEMGWTHCECYNGMGWHNFWKVGEWMETNCTEIYPTQGLFTENEELLGFVFQVFGPSSFTRFEKPTMHGAVEIIGPSRVPDCLANAFKVPPSSLHMYFVDKPWTIKC